MLYAPAVPTFAVYSFLAVYFSVNLPTAVLCVLERTFPSVLVQILVTAVLAVFVQATVPVIPHTVDPRLVLVRAFSLSIGNLTMSLDPSAMASPMVLYREGLIAVTLILLTCTTC